MNKQNKLFERIKKASQNQEKRAFERKDAVWNIVAEKLKPKKRKRMILYRILGAAAVIAVFLFAGFQFTNHQNPFNENPVIDKEVKLDNNHHNTEVVEEVKEELENAESLAIEYLDSTESNAKKPKQIKENKIVSAGVKADLTDEAIRLIKGIEEPIRIHPIEAQDEAIVSSSDTLSQENAPIDSSLAVTEAISKSKKATHKAIDEEMKTGLAETSQVNSFLLKGTVLDHANLSLPDANLLVKETSSATQTDFEGKFSLEVKVGQTLEVSYLGYKTKEVLIEEQKDIVISLQPSFLSEEVVSGYETNDLNDEDVIEFNENDISEIEVPITEQLKIPPPPPPSPEAIVVVEDNREVELKRNPNASLTQTLQGQVAGVNITSSKGQHDANQNVVLRGVSSSKRNNNIPMIVVDGKPINQNEFTNLPPNQIESVKLLKTKAEIFMNGFDNKDKNGVIIILTKKATKEQRKAFDAIVAKTNYPIEPNNEEYESFQENPFTSPVAAPLSTFSIDVDRAAYTNIRRMINNGQTVPKDAVRIEEMLNFFEYEYEKPKGNHPFAIHTTYSDSPWNKGHKLLRIALQGEDIPIDQLPASNLVFLIDVSGSMNDQNKLPLVKKSLHLLVNQMREQDKIALVTYAGNSQVLLEPTFGNEKTKIKNAINNLSSGGGTYASQGIETAYALAEENFVENGNNRVIVATDGDFNIGVTQNESLEDLIAKKRKTNIFLTCLGYGMGNYKDSKMQCLSQKGNGNYAYIDSYQEAQKFLEREFKGSLYAIAKDVKIQIEFNPKHVQSYRLIGYETRMLEDRDFADDTKDAGEIGVNHQVTALYEVIPRGVESKFGDFSPELKYQKTEKPSFESYSDELATVKFRYKEPTADLSTEIERVIKNESESLNQTSADFKFASAVAWFGLKLRDSQLISKTDKEAIMQLAKEGLENDKEGYRAEFIRLVRLYE